MKFCNLKMQFQKQTNSYHKRIVFADIKLEPKIRQFGGIMKKIIKRIIAPLCAVLAVTAGATGYYGFSLPDSYYVGQGERLEIKGASYISAVRSGTEIYASSTATELDTAELKLFGLLPIKTVKVNRVERPTLTACGTPFGIKVLTDGVIVIGLGDVSGYDGIESPAAKAGIKQGDIIKEVNGRRVNSNNEITNAVQNDENKATVLISRNGRELKVEVKPVKSKIDDKLKIGVWVRDSSAGIGTLTFYDDDTMNFGGLGHAICDVDTGVALPISSGEVVSVAISSVTKGTAGNPGELCGSFISRISIGKIKTNTESGVFGSMDFAPVNTDEIPLAFKQEITVGPAQILTTISGTSPKAYDILIEKIDYNYDNVSKNMVIKIIDPELLSKAGGIVQGMSGSPIIQNGRLAGAVTHVFVNDPTRGFGIFSENMYNFSENAA